MKLREHEKKLVFDEYFNGQKQEDLNPKVSSKCGKVTCVYYDDKSPCKCVIFDDRRFCKISNKQRAKQGTHSRKIQKLNTYGI